MNPMTYVVVNLSIISVVWISGKQVDAGIITQGETVALVNYMSQILVELIKMANLIISISKALACANRISSVLEEKSSIVSPAKGMVTASEAAAEGAGAPAKVQFDHVNFLYKGAKADSLTDISLTVKKGQTIGIIGGTGSGKSSLVNLIPRFYDVREGAVLVDGVNVKDYPLETLREKIGVVPQKAILFPGTLRENMRWGKNNATDEEIYRALVREPEILIMDDSASALDFATDAKLRMAIQKGTKDMTVFIVSQRATTIRHADQIVVLDDGAAVGIGTHEELFESCEVYREICLSQLSREEVQ